MPSPSRKGTNQASADDKRLDCRHVEREAEVAKGFTIQMPPCHDNERHDQRRRQNGHEDMAAMRVVGTEYQRSELRFTKENSEQGDPDQADTP